MSTRASTKDTTQARRSFSGAIVAHFIPQSVATSLALSPATFGVGYETTPDDLGIQIEAAEDMHVTLAFLGDARDLAKRVDLDTLEEELAAIAGDTAPLEARVAGLGRFTSVPDGVPHVLYAAIDCPGLARLRERLCDALRAQGADADATHGFTPHCTLAYVAADVGTPPVRLPALSWQVGEVTLGLGDDRRLLSLGGSFEPPAPLLAERSSNNDSDLTKAFAVAFLLSDADRKTLAQQIYLARVQAFTDAYRAQAADLGIDVPDDWTPPDGVLEELSQQAIAAADSIAKTHERDLLAFFAGALAAWHRQHGPFSDTATAAMAQRDLLPEVSDWFAGRAKWKAEQIATAETQGAATMASSLLADDLTSEFGDEESLSGLDFSGLNDGSIVVVVLPGESSNDDCADYAGNMYPLSAYYDLPIPMHPNCVHGKYLMRMPQE